VGHRRGRARRWARRPAVGAADDRSRHPLMARFLFVTWWGGGNLTPVRVLGADLRAAGHEVRVLGPARLRDELAAIDVALIEQAGGFTATPDEVAAEIARTPTAAVVIDFMQPESFAAAEASGTP